MCDCINNLEKQMVGREVKNKRVQKAVLISGAIMFDSFEKNTVSEMELTLDGQKRPYIQNVIHSFCPFCGLKYSKGK